MSDKPDLPNQFNRLFQINEDDLETCERALDALQPLVICFANSEHSEHFAMLVEAIKRVRNDYGPHTKVKIIPP